MGILAGENHGTVEQVTVTGDVTGDEDVGALVGVNGAPAWCGAAPTGPLSPETPTAAALPGAMRA
ncbi:hypothetical protein M5E87_20440 [Flavonifractor plautii]|nr:hypothetical protein M5E87_20440 [Flavonifractor plautii]